MSTVTITAPCVYISSIFATLRYNSCCDVALALLRCGAKIDARESAGEYPLHIAALYMADRVVDLLLR